METRKFFSVDFHARTKSIVTSWTKRIAKAGHQVSVVQLTDSEGCPGHGPGSMGYRIYVIGKAESWDALRKEVIALEPGRRARS